MICLKNLYRYILGSKSRGRLEKILSFKFMKKTATIDLKGKEYATVPARLKEFRYENPNGLIETTPTITDTHIIFKARILKDKSNPASAEATGHSFIEVGKADKEKQFEKQETIAVGRALANIGYAASGEIASSEEMEQFIEFQEEKKAEAIMEVTEQIGNCQSLEELKTLWASLSGEMKVLVKTAQEAKKLQLNENA
jgi:hypothetical protein